MDATTLEHDVVLARDGDHAAFTRLVERTANMVCSIALAIVRNVDASEDVAQESYVAAWSGLHQLRNPSSFLPWLRQLTRNTAHLWRRRHAREIPDDELVGAAVDSRATADVTLIAAEEQVMLAAVLDELSDEAREVLVLFYREGCSTKQVATLLGISDDAVRQRLSRSRALLRAELLQRFGIAVTRTAPGAAFVTTLAAMLPAPTAAAAIASGSAAAASTTTIVKGGVAGAFLGWLGVLVGMKLLGQPFDDREAAELRAFRNRMLVVVTAGAAAVALSSVSMMVMAFTIQALYAVIAYAYIVRLPKILARRTHAQQRQWIRATVGGALTAAITGSMLMAVLVMAARS